MTDSVERRFAELRHGPGRTLEGVALRYGDTATLPWGEERFEPGAFGDVAAADVILNLAHDRTRPIARTGGAGLALLDTAERLAIRADVPPTQDGDDALSLVRAGVLRGLSIEFRAVAERIEGGVRVIERAVLSAIGIVDTPAYPASEVEARRRKGGAAPVANPWIKAQWAARKAGACDCQGPDVESVVFSPGAWVDTLASDREVLAVAGDYSKAVASRTRGTLRLSDRQDGGLTVELTREAGETPAGRDLAGTAKAVPITARPILDNEKSSFTDTGGVRTFTKAHLRAVLLKPSDRPDGWEPVEIAEAPTPKSPKKRAKVWV